MKYKPGKQKQRLWYVYFWKPNDQVISHTLVSFKGSASRDHWFPDPCVCSPIRFVRGLLYPEPKKKSIFKDQGEKFKAKKETLDIC